MTMLKELKRISNKTFTENSALAYRSTGSDCLNFFAACGALRRVSDGVQYHLFTRAYAENPDLAMKTLFYARDIRKGLGERELFRVIISWLAMRRPSSVKRNISLISEYGRWDDLLVLFNTKCEEDAFNLIRDQLYNDTSAMREGKPVSLLAKWLPSVNTSSTERKDQARKLCKYLLMTEKKYRKTLAALRSHIDIVEKHLCANDYSFDYSKIPSCAMLKYQKAFQRNDSERYQAFLDRVLSGTETLHADIIYPYEIVRKCIVVENEWGGNPANLSQETIQALDANWKSLPDYCDGRNALAVIDGSGSMYYGNGIIPAEVAMSLGIYFAERNTGFFRNHFITFSNSPRLVELRGDNIAEKAAYCMSFNECSNTNLCRVFSLLLETAVSHHLSQEELPETIYIISDMEFDYGVDFDRVLFEVIKDMYRATGYKLPTLVYWSVEHRNEQFPVKKDDSGTVLVSGVSPVIFNMVIRGSISPEEYMLSVLNSERYLPITA